MGHIEEHVVVPPLISWNMKSHAVHFIVLLAILSNLVLGCEIDADCETPCVCANSTLTSRRFCARKSIHDSGLADCTTCSSSSSCACTTGTSRPICRECALRAFNAAVDWCIQPTTPTPIANTPLEVIASSPEASTNVDNSGGESTKKEEGGGAGKVVGIVVGSIVGVVAVVVVGIFGVRKWKTRNRVF